MMLMVNEYFSVKGTVESEYSSKTFSICLVKIRSNLLIEQSLLYKMWIFVDHFTGNSFLEREVI